MKIMTLPIPVPSRDENHKPIFFSDWYCRRKMHSALGESLQVKVRTEKVYFLHKSNTTKKWINWSNAFHRLTSFIVGNVHTKYFMVGVVVSILKSYKYT